MKQLNIQLAVEDDSLKLNIPEGADNPELLEEIRENKYELIEFISRRKKRRISFEKIGKYHASSSLRLTPQQTRLFVLQELDRTSVAYNLPQAYEMFGEVDKYHLQETFRRIISRHESLRTRFVLNKEKEPVQQILGEVQFDLESLRAGEKNVDQIIREFVRPFDLSSAPLIRAGLIEVNKDHHILLTDLHHIISDGTSQQLLIQDFGSLYSDVKLPEVTLQYSDYVKLVLQSGLSE